MIATMRPPFGWIRRQLAVLAATRRRMRSRPNRVLSIFESLERRETLSSATFTPFATLPGTITTAGQPAHVTFHLSAGQVTSSNSANVLVGFYAEPAPGSTTTPRITAVDGPSGPLSRVYLPKRGGLSPSKALFIGYLEATTTADQDLTVVVSEPGKQAGNFALEAFLPGDANGDGNVNQADLALVRAAYGTGLGRANNDPAADFNADGHVGCIDLHLTELNQGAHISHGTAAAAIPTAPAPGITQPAANIPANASTTNAAGPTYYYGQPVIQASITVRASTVAPISYAGQPVVPLAAPLATDAIDADYVGSLYHAVLDRAGTTGEIARWVAEMEGGMTAPQVAAGFVNSIEHRQEQVDTYYQEFLNRTPDTLASAWVNDLRAGASEESAVEAILGSPEYQAAHPSNDQFVQGLYVDLLGRQGAAQEIAAWDAALAAGMGRTTAIDDFVNSPEAIDQVLDGFYADYLGRTPEPNTSNAWLQQLDSANPSATAVAIGILSSPEFIQDSTRG